LSSKKKNKMIINYKQCIAARDLLGWKREDLEKNAKISRSTLADFERGARNLRMESLKRILETFKNAGIVFINNGEIGVKIDSKLIDQK